MALCGPLLLHPVTLGAEPRLHDALARAASLAGLPRDVRVQPIHPDLTASPATVRALDAFIVREADGTLRPVIYVNARADLVRQAVEGSELDLHLLAAVLVHELLHLRGEPEAEARKAERAYLARMVRARALPAEVAARYLRRLGAVER